MKKLLDAIEGLFLITFNLLFPFLCFWRVKWGATADELVMELPGDALVPNPRWKYTRAVTVRAPADAVWPWIVQLGQGRGGFYSYELLENLVGCDIHNTDVILPEFQTLEVGDGIRLHPGAAPLPVVEVEPRKYLLLNASMDPKTGGAVGPEEQDRDDLIRTYWLFYLDDRGDGSTRLIVRGSYRYALTLKNRLLMGRLFLEPIAFVMERKMLLGIKSRASQG